MFLFQHSVLTVVTMGSPKSKTIIPSAHSLLVVLSVDFPAYVINVVMVTGTRSIRILIINAISVRL
jgi:hypothetical protein